MSWTHAAPLAALAFLGFIVLLCVRDARRKGRARRNLNRLNSPFFRNVYDAYYRVGNINGVGR